MLQFECIGEPRLVKGVDEKASFLGKGISESSMVKWVSPFLEHQNWALGAEERIEASLGRQI